MLSLTVLPAALGVLTKLTILKAGCNPLTTIEDGLFPSLSNLTELDIGFSETLQTLPDKFDQLANLNVLHAGNNRLKELPISLFSCEQLKELQLYGNDLTFLDDQLSKLKRLHELNVGRNQIKKIPSTIGDCQHLRVLHCYENCLSSLPSSLVNIPKLQTLTVHGNNLPVPPRDVRSQPGATALAKFYATTAAS